MPTADALTAFLAGPADAAAADRAALAPEADLLAAVATLAAERRRAHLELLGRPGFAKAVRKAASKAAYQLKSAGVAAEPVERAAPRNAAVGADLTGVALVGAPGLAAHYWLLLAELPDATPVALEAEAWGGPVHVTVLEHMSPGRLRHYEREMKGEVLPGKPIVAHADLGLAHVAHLTAAIRDAGGTFPQGWAQVLWWCERARLHGADAARADASSLLAAEPALSDAELEATRALYGRPELGPQTPEQAVIDALIARVLDAADRPDGLTRAELDDRLDGLADASCDAYFADAAVAASRARALRATADVALAGGHRAAARELLAVAEHLASGSRLPHELGLLSQAFRRVIRYDLVWERHASAARSGDPTAP